MVLWQESSDDGWVGRGKKTRTSGLLYLDGTQPKMQMQTLYDSSRNYENALPKLVGNAVLAEINGSHLGSAQELLVQGILLDSSDRAHPQQLVHGRQ